MNGIDTTVRNGNITTVSQQWMMRPDDERYLSIEALKTAVQSRKMQSWTTLNQTASLRVVPDGGTLRVQVQDRTSNLDRLLNFSHWSFGQLAGLAKSPAGYLRTLPAPIAAIPLQYCLERNAVKENALILAQTNGTNTLRAVTSPTYGRIWDIQVVEAVERVNQSGRWKVPAASYADRNPKKASTLYASDRDVFMFLVDPEKNIEVAGRKYARGFFTWNSEVGSAVFGLCTFLYDYVCDNRIIWGATNVQELRIRHTSGAPERFAYEGARYLTRYAEESTSRTVEIINRAATYELPNEEPDSVEKWLTARGFTAAIAASSIEAAQQEEGEARSLLDIVNGVTAYARGLTRTDERVALEIKASKLLNLVAE